MKRVTLILSLFLSMLPPAFADSVPKGEVAADAKWILHLEADQFRATKVGGFVMTELLEKELREPVEKLNTKLKLDINVNKILEGINSITIYGNDYQSPQNHAVLLLRASPELENVLVGFLAAVVLEGTNTPMQATQTQEDGVSFYALKDTVYCAVLPGKVIAIGRSREVTENAAKVLTGKAPSLSSDAAFTEFGDTQQAFFFLGVAQGFNLGNNLPPQAKLLQAADAGRIVLGEESDQVFLSLALRGKTPDVVAQMEQVVQGLIAIGSLSQPQDKDVAGLLHSIKVSTNGSVVNIGVNYPIDRAIEQLTHWRDKQLEKHSHKPEAGAPEAATTNPPTGSGANSTN